MNETAYKGGNAVLLKNSSERNCWLLGAMLVISGCAAQLRAVSSGQIGCSDSEIEISEDNFGFGTRTWTSTCSGRTYYCSSHGGGENSTAQVSCRESQQPRNDDPPPAMPAPAPGQGCQYDAQCKGDRICQSGRCMEPGQGQAKQPQAGNPGRVEVQSEDPVVLKSECDRGKVRSCVGLAKLYEDGKGVPQERARAAELYEKACRDGSAAGCKGMMRTAK